MAEKKRGRPRRHWAEDLRIEVWYREVQRQSKWSDYRLNIEFAWTEYGQELIRQSKAEKGDLTTTHRPRIFEWIRKTGKKPAGRDKKWRNMEQIVNAVDTTFSGTKNLYHTKFWDLLQIEKIDATVVATEIDKLLYAFNLVRIDYHDSQELQLLINKYGHQAVFDRCLRVSLKKMDELSKIEFIWYLYIQAEPASQIRQIIVKIADPKIEAFFENYFPITKAWNYAMDALQTLHRTKLNLDNPIVEYEITAELANRLILPKELVNSITENHLFHAFEIKMLTQELE